MKKVLMVAFHFPPQRGSSGILRTLSFTRYLPQHGWQPLVLTAHARAYEETSAELLEQLPATLTVRRAFALNTRRHLALRGRYPGWLALPDRWWTWWLGAVPAGLVLIRAQCPRVIWSTYPIASAHLIGLTLHKLSGLPWIADLRDPMFDDSHPAPGPVRRCHQWIEAAVVAHSTRVVCTTPGAVALYRARYPRAPAERFCLIENGYDEEDFAGLPAPAAGVQEPLRLLHSGLIYPSERDPRALFAALAQLRGQLPPLRLMLRATGHDAHLAALIAEANVGDMVELGPALPYRAALEEMRQADGLLILQAANCNAQIPAKLYEYLRSGRPVLGLTDPGGDTAGALRDAGIAHIAALDDSAAIAATLADFVRRIAAGSLGGVDAQTASRHSRRARTGLLAALLDEISA